MTRTIEHTIAYPAFQQQIERWLTSLLPILSVVVMAWLFSFAMHPKLFALVGVLYLCFNLVLSMVSATWTNWIWFSVRLPVNILFMASFVLSAGESAPGWVMCLPLVIAAASSHSWLRWGALALPWIIGGFGIFLSRHWLSGMDILTAVLVVVILATVVWSLVQTQYRIHCRQMMEKTRKDSLLSALNMCLHKISDADSESEIYEIVGRAFLDFGLNLVVLRWEETQMGIRHMTFSSKPLAKAERLAGIRASEFRCDPSCHPFFVGILEKGETRFLKEGASTTAAATGLPLFVASQILKVLQWNHMIGTPLRNRKGDVEGCLIIMGEHLGAKDTDLVVHFSRQISTGLARTRLIEALRDERDALNRALQDTIELRKEKQLASRAAERASRLASLGTLAAGLAHEINNPLTFVMANALFLEQQMADSNQDGVDAEVKSAIGDIYLGTQRMAELIRNVKLFSSASDTTRQYRFDVNDVILSTIAIVSSQISYVAQFESELGDNCMVHGNPSRMGQVVINLLLNAIQAIPKNRSAENRIVLTSVKSSDGVLIRVTDSGCGIDATELDSIFDPFFTTKAVGVGTGLGLSIVLSIIEDMDGTLEVESTKSVGTTFIARLPFCEADQADLVDKIPRNDDYLLKTKRRSRSPEEAPN